MRSLPALCAVLLTAAGCASTPTPHGLVRVDLPGPEVGPGSPQERALTEAIGDVAFGEGLACQPGAGATLLRCSAAAVGSRSRGVTLALTRSGTGYEVSIDQPIRLPGTSSPVCGVQRRLLDRIDAEVQAPVAKVDTRSDCKK